MKAVKRFYALVEEIHEHGPWCGSRCTELVLASDFDALAEGFRAGIHNYAELAKENAVLSARARELEARVAELEPGAECWHALSACYRMTCMGSAGLGPAGLAGYAHITMNLWTGTPEQIRRLIESTGRAPNVDEQDKHGRELFGKFIKVAVQNAALVSPTGAT